MLIFWIFSVWNISWTYVFAKANPPLVNHWWENFNLNTLFVNWKLSQDKQKIHSVESAIWAIIKLITWVIWWFAVLWTVLWGFFILTSWWGDDWMNKWKKIIIYSLVWLALSLVSYTMIQLVQLFLFSFEK